MQEAFIARTESVESKVNAFISYDKEDALAQAKASDDRRSAGTTLSPLTVYQSPLRM